MEPAVVEGREVARPLSVLGPLIRQDLKQGDEAAESASMPYYIAAGEKMLEAKEQLLHGEFYSWLRRNAKRGKDQCILYMKLARAHSGADNSAAVEFSSLKDFRRRGLGHDVPTSSGGVRRPDWQEPIKENIKRARAEAQRLAAERLSQQQERDAERKLALRVIDIGYKILVKELHPDKGGSRDAMQRLNRARARLKQHA